MKNQVETLKAENAELRKDVDNLVGMMTNVVSLLLELEFIENHTTGHVSDETRERFQRASGIYHGYVEKKVIDTASGILERFSKLRDDPA